MHRRRGFDKARVEGSKSGKTLAEIGLRFYKKLYDIEEDIKNETPEEIYRIRQEKAKPLWDQMKLWAEEQKLKVPPDSKIGKALRYLLNQYSHLTRYLEDGRYQIDNGEVERVIRKYAIGRNNWLFSQSEGGAHANATLYSLVLTAKLNKVNTFYALNYIFRELPKMTHPDQISDLADILMGIKPIPDHNCMTN